MKIIAVLTGGNAAERAISAGSARTVYDHLPRDRYRPYLIELKNGRFVESESGATLDLNDFSWRVGERRVRPDVVYGSIHGDPFENGKLQGYFDLVGIPYTGAAPTDMALTFDKQLTKIALQPHRVPLARSVRLRRGETISQETIARLAFPLFVKPNANGSSYGVSRVERSAELGAALDKGFGYDDSLLIEEFLDGREFTQGVYRDTAGKTVVLPLTEIITPNHFFDYEAKYQGRSEEVTPAAVSPDQATAVAAQTRLIYRVLGLRGVSRVDYILREEQFFVLEVNTVPGMSAASIIPQQCAVAGIPLGELLHAVVRDASGKQ